MLQDRSYDVCWQRWKFKSGRLPPCEPLASVPGLAWALDNLFEPPSSSNAPTEFFVEVDEVVSEYEDDEESAFVASPVLAAAVQVASPSAVYVATEPQLRAAFALMDRDGIGALSRVDELVGALDEARRLAARAYEALGEAEVAARFRVATR